MEKIERMIEIAKAYQQHDLVAKCELLQQKNQGATPLILPLVGEFSSGKTSLINALTDSKQLASATQPTTSTIYEIFFGREKNETCIVKENGDGKIIEGSSLSETQLEDDGSIVIFDTSKKIPSSVVLVDTPGLSSSDPKHQQVLADFIPHADAILLVVDINQSITKSLTRFVQNMNLVGRRIYLVVTKCDTKSPSEKQAIVDYIKSTSELKLRGVACVSANKGDYQEFLELVGTIEKEKSQILQQVNETRQKQICEELRKRLSELLNETTDNQLEQNIKKCEKELKEIKENIRRLVEESKDELDDVKKKALSHWKIQIAQQLESVITSKCTNYDAEVETTINNTASQIIFQYQQEIQATLYSCAQEYKSNEGVIAFPKIEEMDFSSIPSDMPYHLNLNNVGHEYDGWISGGAKVLLAVAATVTVGALAGGAGVATATVVSAADTASDVISILSNAKLKRQLQETLRTAGENAQKIDELDQKAGAKIGVEKGVIDEIVKRMSEEHWGKPQRQRAVEEYLHTNLVPLFKDKIEALTLLVLNTITEHLEKQTQEILAQKKQNLEKWREEQKESQAEFEKRRNSIINDLKELEDV